LFSSLSLTRAFHGPNHGSGHLLLGRIDERQAPVKGQCEVHRADWSESKERFIVYRKYAKRSMHADEYHALISDPGWEMRPLL
jgi:hypothetical protein